MKRIAALAICAALALALAGCGGGDGGPRADTVKLGARLAERAEGLPDMTAVSSENEAATGAELFPYLSDMDYAKVAGFYLSYATGGSPEEIALTTVRDAADLAEARASLERHLENRRNLFRTYDPEGEALLAKARLASVGDTAALFVCENAAALESAFRAEIS